MAGEKRYGQTSSIETFDFDAFNNKVASSACNTPLIKSQPVSTGFLGITLMFFLFNAEAIWQAIYVLPTLVSVPVMNNPFIKYVVSREMSVLSRNQKINAYGATTLSKGLRLTAYDLVNLVSASRYFSAV